MPNTAPETFVPVAVGILEDAQRRILVTRRADHQHQGGKWEFPGGKIHPGEAMPAALARELDEELGVALCAAQPLVRVRHAYSDKAVLLDVWRVTDYGGEPHGREGQPLRWASRAELAALDLPAADRPILRALELPPLYLISDAVRIGVDAFMAKLERVLQAGLRLLQLREPEMTAEDFRRLAVAVTALAHRHGAKVLLNAEPAEVAACGADGVHLNARRLMATSRRPLPGDFLVAASCHDAAELCQASRIGVDFAVLSPVRATVSHPGASPLGWPRFAELRLVSDVPVYALGGVLPEDRPRARAAGAVGLAMIRGIWDAPDIAAAVRESLR